ncbi:DUF6053 domain-containing protein [Lysobacter enzymogenes]|uniref:DUF6053 domain-containing protein n=1 Tax=Lysobacter enzymogenes TaxID=69 RepID=UPI003D18A62C
MGGTSVPTPSVQVVAIGHKGVGAEAPPTTIQPAPHRLAIGCSKRSRESTSPAQPMNEGERSRRRRGARIRIRMRHAPGAFIAVRIMQAEAIRWPPAMPRAQACAGRATARDDACVAADRHEACPLPDRDAVIRSRTASGVCCAALRTRNGARPANGRWPPPPRPLR